MNQHTCTCANSQILQEGETCEICMGTVSAQGQVGTSHQQHPDFNEQYFEELESWFEAVDFAA